MTHIRYFLTGNTAAGYQSLLPEAMNKLQYLTIIEGPYLSDNVGIMNRIRNELERGLHAMELIHHPSAPDDLLGIILPNIKLGIFISSPPHLISIEKFRGPVTTLNVYDFYDVAKLKEKQTIVEQLSLEITEQHQNAYRGYSEALNIHDEWEKIYIQQSNFSLANAYSDELAQKLFPEGAAAVTSPIHQYRFLGAATPKGAIDFVPQLTDGLKRFLIKGRPGSGKSTLLRKLVDRGTQLGYELEIYQCGLDPKSLDMIICRELGFAIFDSTAPHEYEPTEEDDEVIDMYQIAIEPNTDEEYSEELKAIATRYREQMKTSNLSLANAAKLEAVRAELTKDTLDIEQLTKVEAFLLKYISSLA